jgi:transcriptional regulator with XRE-family HTH domain
MLNIVQAPISGPCRSLYRIPSPGEDLMSKRDFDETLVNVLELGKHLKRRRLGEHMSLRAVARETDVSASTLSRIENGSGVPDADTLARLARWLEIPLERIVTTRIGESLDAVVYYPDNSTPDIVEAHLRADRNLTPETARALSELFRVAYKQFGGQSVQPAERRADADDGLR